jgi:hypothetical protein
MLFVPMTQDEISVWMTAPDEASGNRPHGRCISELEVSFDPRQQFPRIERGDRIVVSAHASTRLSCPVQGETHDRNRVGLLGPRAAF